METKFSFEDLKILWKKWEIVGSQAEIYPKLPFDYGVYFFEKGSCERKKV